jgi:hypothetical protein
MYDGRGSTAHRRVTRALALVAALLPVALLPATPASANQPAGVGLTAAVEDTLVAGGNFTTAGGATVNRIAGWDGVDWSALTGPSGTGADGAVFALTEFEGDLIAGGSFINAGGVPVSGIASWDGTQWSPLVGSSGVPGVTVAPLGFVSSLQVYNGDLYVGGAFPRAGGTLTVNNIARWDGNDWSALPGPGGVGVTLTGSSSAPVWDLTLHAGELVAAGTFDSAGGVSANSVASWDGTGWSSLGMPPLGNLTVLSATAYDADLVVGAHYVENNFNVRRILRHDGGAWTPLSGPSGTDFNGDIRALTVWGDDLYAGGGFTHVDSLTLNRVVRWDGSDWSPLTGSSGTGVNTLARAFAVWEGALYVGGHFTQAGGVTVNHIARWDGSDWSALVAPSGTIGTSDDVFALLAT